MKAPEAHRDEVARLAVVQELDLLTSEKDETFERVLRLSKLIFDVPISAFSVVGANHQHFKSSFGLDVPKTARDVSFCGHTILQDDLFEIPDAASDLRFADNPLVTGNPNIRFYAGAPVKAANGLPVGALCLIDHVPRRLEGWQRQALTDLRDILESDLALRSTIFHDHLTQLFNRRFLDNYLERETRRAHRDQLPLTLMLIDIDHFKPYNDFFGHPAGDATLRKVAALIERCCQRPGDISARYGGEEFAIVLPNTDLPGSLAVAARLRKMLADNPIAHPGSATGAVTISAGAVVVSRREDFRQGHTVLLEAADQMLYVAKRGGRDRAEISIYAPVN